jgi:electron transfer flavoprotein alpha subunit
MKKIGIIIETENRETENREIENGNTENNQVKETNYGVITLARQDDTQIYAFIIDGMNDGIKENLAAWGVHGIVDMGFQAHVMDNPVVKAANLVAAVKELDIHTILGLSSPGGRDLIPRMAALLDAPLVMDCMDVDLKKNVAKTSQYSGKAIASIQLTGDFVLFGIRPNAVQAVPFPCEPECFSFEVDNSMPDNFKVLPRVLDSEQSGSDVQDISLSEAEIIIAGGRGMKNKENFSILFDCAEKLNATVGASRVAVDLGWIPYAHQVGQTGEKVSPLVYIACGISGSIQHFAGMKTAKMIIAVNSDENTAIMANSDYYVKGDVMEIIPELTKQL